MIAVGLALAGCTSLRPQVASFATDYNRAIADTRNQLALLNIARSSVGEPAHHSALSQVEATLTYKAGASDGAERQKHILFAVEHESSGPAAILVEHRGKRHAIPARQAGQQDRSARVIALINQMLALQTSAEALKRNPSTVRVR